MYIVFAETMSIDEKSYTLIKSVYMWKNVKLCKPIYFIIFEYEE